MKPPLQTQSQTTIAARLLSGILAVLLIALMGAEGAQGDSADLVTISPGTVEGIVRTDGIRVFKGIPFAAPPVGDLRWKAPQPVKPWDGVRGARDFGPVPMPAFSRPNEDCLYLNLWTGAKDAAEKRPVMVYIYGGAFNGGAGSDGLYDGTHFAKRGVVLVTFNHRVGIFGFLAHPELSAESGKGSGCYGIQDQIAALRWVKENIERFGGDPGNVTLFGQSSGGTSVSILSQSPLARGLFHRAICQSGGAMAPIKEHADKPGGMIGSLALGESLGKAFFASLGVNDLKAARALTAEQAARGNAGLPWPVADGEVIVGDPQEIFDSGRFSDTPVLAGITSDDGGFFAGGGASPADFEKAVRDEFGSSAAQILAAYPHATAAETRQSARSLAREKLFGWPTWSWVKLQSEKGRGKAYLYYFDHGGKPGEAGHGADVPYVFGNLGLSRFSAEKRAMSDAIMSYWVNFARNGDPNGEGLPEWPAFSSDSARSMVFRGTPQAVSPPGIEKFQAFDAYWARVRKERQ